MPGRLLPVTDRVGAALGGGEVLIDLGVLVFEGAVDEGAEAVSEGIEVD